MKSSTLAGIVLLVIGIISLAYQGITYTTHKKAIDIGPVEVTKTENHMIPLPPVIGGVSLVGGVVLLAMGARKVA